MSQDLEKRMKRMNQFRGYVGGALIAFSVNAPYIIKIADFLSRNARPIMVTTTAVGTGLLTTGCFENPVGPQNYSNNNNPPEENNPPLVPISEDDLYNSFVDYPVSVGTPKLDHNMTVNSLDKILGAMYTNLFQQETINGSLTDVDAYLVLALDGGEHDLTSTDISYLEQNCRTYVVRFRPQGPGESNESYIQYAREQVTNEIGSHGLMRRD